MHSTVSAGFDLVILPIHEGTEFSWDSASHCFPVLFNFELLVDSVGFDFVGDP